MKLKKVVTIGLSVVLGSITLTGCGSGDELSQLRSMKSLSSDAGGTDYNLSLSEKQSMIYAQVSERKLLDLSILDECTEEELQQVTAYMNNVDSQLTGGISRDNGVIDSCFTDYLLSEFEKTSYYWQRTKTAVRGVDASSRSIIVDVTYKTIGFNKEVVKDSFIVEGEPNYEKKQQVRFERWLRILSAKYNGNSSKGWEPLYNEFMDIYGDPQDIFESQRNLDLTEQVYETGNQKTYGGMVDTPIENQGAKMTIRYVLVPKYVLGINLGLSCQHMYVTNYELEGDPTTDMKIFKEDGYTTISDNVQLLMHSYFQCIDEADMSGLYKLTHKFEGLDKYFLDMFDTTYTKHNSFSVSLFNIEGTNIKAGVQVSSKIRVKGSNMTMPSYTDRYYVEFSLIDDQLKVTNMVLLSRKLEGEPAITTEDANDSGFVAKIDLSNTSKASIEKLICDFSALQLLGDYTSDDFMKVMDYSVSDEKLAETRANMTKVGGTKKVVFLQNYQQGTSNYASVKCREVYQQEDNSITEASVTYEFIMKGDKWYVYDYNVLSSVRLDTTNLSTTNSLCYVTPGKVEKYTSQIVSTKGDSGDSKSDVTDGIVFEHEETQPVLKNGSQEQGLVKIGLDSLTDTQFGTVWSNIGSTMSIDKQLALTDIKELDSALGLSGDNSMETMAKKLSCIYFNKTNNRYQGNEFNSEIDAFKSSYNEIKELWQGGNSDTVKKFSTYVTQVDKLG